jgi:DNA-binding response OmpR family regulator
MAKIVIVGERAEHISVLLTQHNNLDICCYIDLHARRSVEKPNLLITETKDNLLFEFDKSCPGAEIKISKPVQLVSVLEQVGKLEQWQEIGSYMFSSQERVIKLSSETITLTEKESLILECLLESGEPIKSAELLQKVWGYSSVVDTHTLQTHIYRLRQKLGDSAGILRTTEAGYVLAKWNYTKL